MIENGWHLDQQIDATRREVTALDIPETLRALIDHMGFPQRGAGPEQIETPIEAGVVGNIHVKLSAPYRISLEPPPHRDAQCLFRALLAANPRNAFLRPTGPTMKLRNCRWPARGIHSDRVLIHVDNGKGGKDRKAMLSHRLADLLRDCRSESRPEGWLFPGKINPLSPRQLNRAFTSAKHMAGIAKPATLHTHRQRPPSRFGPHRKTWCDCGAGLRGRSRSGMLA
jgi:hypothetical protein